MTWLDWSDILYRCVSRKVGKVWGRVESKCWLGKHLIIGVVTNFMKHPHGDGEERVYIKYHRLSYTWKMKYKNE